MSVLKKEKADFQCRVLYKSDSRSRVLFVRLLITAKASVLAIHNRRLNSTDPVPWGRVRRSSHTVCRNKGRVCEPSVIVPNCRAGGMEVTAVKWADSPAFGSQRLLGGISHPPCYVTLPAPRALGVMATHRPDPQTTQDTTEPSHTKSADINIGSGCMADDDFVKERARPLISPPPPPLISALSSPLNDIVTQKLKWGSTPP